MPTITRKLVSGPSNKKLLDALEFYAEDPVVPFIVTPVDQESLEQTEETPDGIIEDLLRDLSHFPTSVNSITVGGARGELWLVKGVISQNRSTFTSGPSFTVEILFNIENPSDSGDLKVSWESVRHPD